MLFADMEGVGDKLQQCIGANEYSVTFIRTNAELLELMYDEWRRLQTRNCSSVHARTIDVQLSVANQLVNDLEIIKTKMMAANKNIVQALSTYDDVTVKPIFDRIDRRFNAQVGILSDSAAQFRRAYSVPPTVARVSEHVQQIHKHYDFLREKLDASSVARELFSREAITIDEKESVTVNDGSMTKAADVLLQALLQKPQSAFDAFKHALIKTNQDDIYLKLADIGKFSIVISL
jgi:hypothetical protein